MTEIEIEFRICEVSGNHIASAKYEDRWHSGIGASYNEAEVDLVTSIAEYKKNIKADPVPPNKIIKIN